MRKENPSEPLIAAAAKLRDAVERLRFQPPVTHVYNPLRYAWTAHETYLRRFGSTRKRVLFLGMNPGPFGMVQTGVPFGEVAAVRDWLKITCQIEEEKNAHPKRPVSGFDCERSEVSGQRLWGLFGKRFDSCEDFFNEHIVMNYCPLAFMESTGRNRTPDKLPLNERDRLFKVCDEHLRSALTLLKPEFIIGIGDFAAKRAQEVSAGMNVKVARILHPSPASPAANRDWAGVATRQMIECGAWK